MKNVWLDKLTLVLGSETRGKVNFLFKVVKRLLISHSFGGVYGFAVRHVTVIQKRRRLGKCGEYETRRGVELCSILEGDKREVVGILWVY